MSNFAAGFVVGAVCAAIGLMVLGMFDDMLDRSRERAIKQQAVALGYAADEYQFKWIIRRQK